MFNQDFNRVTAMSTTAILFADENTGSTLPQSVLPTIQNRTINRLADHLGSLYVEGNAAYDSYILTS